MGQEDIVAQGEEMLNKLTRAELVALNRAIVRRIKVMDDFHSCRNYQDISNKEKKNTVEAEVEGMEGAVMNNPIFLLSSPIYWDFSW